MPNTFQYVDWLSMEGLRLLKNKLQCAQFANTDYVPDYKKAFAVGETIRVPIPQRFTIRDGLEYTPQGINRIVTTVQCNQIFGVDFEWDDAEAALKMERGQARVKKEYLEPAMAQIAQETDSRFAQFAYQNTNNIVGVLGTDPTSFQTINEARASLVRLACPPQGKRGLIIPPQVNVSLTNAGIQYFNPQSDTSERFREGYIGKTNGFSAYESMSLWSHTSGTRSGDTNTISGGGQSGSSLLLGCTSGDTYFKGDVFQIADVYEVNPMTRRRTGTKLKQFVITQDVTASASTVTVQISPTIYGPGSQYQNVSALPAGGATVTFFPGTSSPNGKSGIQSLAIHRDAFAMVGVPLEMPKAIEMGSQTRDPETGLSVRFVRAWNPQLSKMINRFDVLMGFGVLYGDNCSVRLLGA